MKIFNRFLIFNHVFLILAQNIDCEYTLEPPRGSNEYPQSMFWIKNKKIRYTPASPSFTISKWGIKGYFYSRTCFPDENPHFAHAQIQKNLPREGGTGSKPSSATIELMFPSVIRDTSLEWREVTK